MGRCSRSGSDSGRRNARRDARPPPRRGTPLLNRPQRPATRRGAGYQGRQLPSPTGQGDAIDSRRIVFGRRAGWHHWHHRRSDLACICPSLVPTSSEPLELSIQREASSSKRRLSSNVPAGTRKIHSSSSVQHLIHQSIHDRQIRRLTTRHLRDHATSRATVRLAIALSELLCKHAAHAAVTDRVATLSDPRDE